MSRGPCLEKSRIPEKPRVLIVKRLTWDFNDLSEAIRKELSLLSEYAFPRCLYLNPMFKVIGSEPAGDFFREVRKCQREWFRVLTRQFGSANWRKMKWSIQDPTERRMSFSGVLFINGREVDPWQQYQLEAAVGLHPESDIVVARRPFAITGLHMGNWDSLIDLSRSELKQHLATGPLDPVYVLPENTVMGFKANAQFYAEAERRSREWHRQLCRTLGNTEYQKLLKAAPWPTKILGVHGALVVQGAIYLPGHWPNKRPKKTRNVPEWARDFIVPRERLGL